MSLLRPSVCKQQLAQAELASTCCVPVLSFVSRNLNLSYGKIDRIIAEICSLMPLSVFFPTRIYQSLPEVRKMQEEKKRNDYYKTNRLRAQLYKQVKKANIFEAKVW